MDARLGLSFFILIFFDFHKDGRGIRQPANTSTFGFSQLHKQNELWRIRALSSHVTIVVPFRETGNLFNGHKLGILPSISLS